MFSFLARIFIHDYRNYSHPQVRRSYGTLCLIFTIILNILLAVAKLITAGISGSFAIRADGINNLTDVASSLVLMLAFCFAGMKPQPNRPFGHGRIEYIAGFAIATLIIICGFETGLDAIRHIIKPEPLTFSWLTTGVLCGSIALKFYMSYIILSTGKKISSDALRASGMESMSDTISTFATLAGLLLFQFTPSHWNLDGWLGLFVAILILKAGIESAWETLLQLLGTKPEPELVKQISDICMSFEHVLGLHDLVIHNYGPGRLHVSAHCEMPGNIDVYKLHDITDQIMRKLDDTLGCESVIHLDPICTDNQHVTEMKEQLIHAVKQLNEQIKIHDFRIVEGPTHTNVIFDCLVPLNVEPDDEKAKEKVSQIACSLWPNTFAIVKIDRPYA